MIEKEAGAHTAADLAPDVLDRSFAALHGNFDATWGGFGQEPKFPHALDIRVCLRHWKRTGNPLALEVVTTTLDRMSEGGVYDQLGGGFHRYSTDEMWLIPHFEKMLYDNALLIPAYLDAHVATGGRGDGAGRYARIARECCEWILREMTTPESGFASTQDADTEGEEGLFFTWTPEELDQVLGSERGLWAAEWFGVTPEGNFEHGRSALWRHDTANDIAARLKIDAAELIDAMGEVRQALFETRAKRVAPGTDDKVLTGWNGLAISALAQSCQVLGEGRYLDAARGAARYVLDHMRQENGRLFATARAGRAHLNGYLSDYVFLIQGLVDLYETDFDEGWIRSALELEAIVEEDFLDREGGGYFTTGKKHEELIARLKDPHDGALPSASSVHALNLLRLAELTGAGRLASMAESCIRAVGELVNRYPSAFSQLLLAVDNLAVGGREIVIAGERDDAAVREMLAVVRSTYLPQRVVALAHAGANADVLELVRGRAAESGRARAYVCRNYACDVPATTPDELRRQLR
jgi:hypothetical protein